MVSDYFSGKRDDGIAGMALLLLAGAGGNLGGCESDDGRKCLLGAGNDGNGEPPI